MTKMQEMNKEWVIGVIDYLVGGFEIDPRA